MSAIDAVETYNKLAEIVRSDVWEMMRCDNLSVHSNEAFLIKP